MLFVWLPLMVGAPGRETAESIGRPSPSIDALVSDLGSPSWSQRERAADALLDEGPACYDALRRAFRETDAYDTRRRIKHLAQIIFLTEQLGPRRAFLGISHRRSALTVAADPRVPGWATGLFITDIFRGTAADQIGLRRGDLVLALNGESATLDAPATDFTLWISKQRPGAECSLRVLRGGEGLRYEGGRSILLDDGRPKRAEEVPEKRFNPTALKSVRVSVARNADDARVPREYIGLAITDVAEVDPSLDIRTGDLVLSLNDQPLREETAERDFQLWTQGEWVGGSERVGPPNVGKDNKEAGPSIQLVRGGEGIVFHLKLGRWPTNLQTWQAWGNSITPDYTRASEAFDAWWTASFDPERTFADGADDDAAWQLDPREAVP